MTNIQPKIKNDKDLVDIKILIEDFEELKSAREVRIRINSNLSIAETIQKIATKGNVQIIASNYEYGIANFDLVQTDHILPKDKKLKELIPTLLDLSQVILLKQKKREQITLTFEISDFQQLNCARTVNAYCYKDQSVQETMHKIARKGNVFIPVQEEPDYALFLSKDVLMDGSKTLESYNLQNKDLLILKKKQDAELNIYILIEEYKVLGTPRKISCLLKKELTVADALKKIASLGKVGIPSKDVPNYDLFILNDGIKMDKNKQLMSYVELKSKDTIVLRKTEEGKEPEAPAHFLIDIKEIEVTEKIGQGSSAKVLKGVYRGRDVALKQLKEAPGDERYQVAVKEFQSEVEILSKSFCPYIVKFYGVIEKPKLCVVMELCNKGSLYHVMNSVVYDFGWDRTFKMATEMCLGLNFLHSQDPQIVHRDLKSLNLLVTESFDLKICDFGLSRFKTAVNFETLRKLRGTAVWSAPEILSEAEFSDKSDIYSAGVILWELIFRCIKGKYQRPFAEYKELMFDYQILVGAGRGIRPTIPQNTPEPVANLIKSCWSPNPVDRPNARQILDILGNLQKDYEKNPRTWDRVKEEGAHPV